MKCSRLFPFSGSWVAGISCLLLVGLVLPTQTTAQQAPTYDSALAAYYEADDYGMRQYVFTILKTGSNTSLSKAETDSIFAGHLANINRLVAAGKLIVAGPLQRNEKNYRGLFFFTVKTLEEATLLLETDPAIQSKALEAENYIWYGAAALPAYLEVNKKIEKISIGK